MVCLIFPTLRFKLLAKLNFLISLSALNLECAPNQTYLDFPVTVSFHDANHSELRSWITSFHWCPGRGSGALASLPILIVISSGYILYFKEPILG